MSVCAAYRNCSSATEIKQTDTMYVVVYLLFDIEDVNVQVTN